MIRITVAIRVAFLFVAIAFMTIAAVRAEDSQAIEKKDVPAAVLAAFERAYPDAEIIAIEKEKTKDQVIFEFEINDGKNERDVIYLENGALFAIEEAISITALPEAVVDALKKTYPKGEIDEAEKVTRGSETEYEVVVEVVGGGKETEYEITVSSSGQIIDQIQIGEGEDDDEGEGDDKDVDDEEDEG